MKNTIRDIKKDIEKYKMMLEKKESYLKQTGIPTKNVLTADEINNIGSKFDGLIEYLAEYYNNFPNPDEKIRIVDVIKEYFGGEEETKRIIEDIEKYFKNTENVERIIKEIEDKFSDDFKNLISDLKKYEERLNILEREKVVYKSMGVSLKEMWVSDELAKWLDKAVDNGVITLYNLKFKATSKDGTVYQLNDDGNTLNIGVVSDIYVGNTEKLTVEKMNVIFTKQLIDEKNRWGLFTGNGYGESREIYTLNSASFIIKYVGMEFNNGM